MNNPLWLTSLGNNSAQLQVPANASLVDVQDTIEAYITAHGWTLHDGIMSGSLKRVYKALNKDGVTFKYAAIDFSYISYYKTFMVSVWELWDELNHIGSNSCAYSEDFYSYAQKMNLSQGQTVFIFAHPRYLVMQAYPKASMQGNSWIGCIEVARDNPEDTAAKGYPCVVWANGYMLFSTASPLSFPRTRDESISFQAAQTVILCAGGLGGQTNTGGQVLINSIPDAQNIWNNKNWAFTPRAGKYYGDSSEIKGRLFGLKILAKNTGSLMDEMQITIDGDLFYSAAGTLAKHYILTGSDGGRIAVPA